MYLTEVQAKEAFVPRKKAVASWNTSLLLLLGTPDGKARVQTWLEGGHTLDDLVYPAKNPTPAPPSFVAGQHPVRNVPPKA